MAGQDAAPAVCASQAWIPGRFGEPSAPTTWGCLQWLDWAGRGKRKFPDRDAKSDPPVCRKYGPEVRNRRKKQPGRRKLVWVWSAARRACPQFGTHASQDAGLIGSASWRSAPSSCEGAKENTGAPAPKKIRGAIPRVFLSRPRTSSRQRPRRQAGQGKVCI